MKTHVSRYFGKTGTPSQAELAKLIAAIPVAAKRTTAVDPDRNDTSPGL
ncbi:hypothetical protein [Neorhizobium sp. LjRoot104]